MIKPFVICILAIVFLLIGCESETIETIDVATPGRGLYIVCEGLENQENASLSYYNITGNVIYKNIFRDVNNFGLGELACSMLNIDSVGYIMVTNSSYVIAINNNNQKHLAVLTNMYNPRYMAKINTEKAYITSESGNIITILNLQNQTVLGNINCGHPSNLILTHPSYTFITTNDSSNLIIRINHSTDLIIDSISLPIFPNSICADKYNKLWALCDEKTLNNASSAKLVKIDINTLTIEQTLTFDSISMSPHHLFINNTKDSLYFINSPKTGKGNFQGGLFKMGIQSNTLPSTPFIAEQSNVFGTGTIDPLDKTIYITDIADGISEGKLIKHSSSGKELLKTNVGINPIYISFK